MKNFGNYKKFVEVLRKKDKENGKVQERTFKNPKISSFEDMEDFIEDCLDTLDQHLEDSTSMLSYESTKLELLEDEQKILKKIEKQEDPEDILFSLDSSLFKDYEFIANVIAICAPKIGSKREEEAKAAFDKMKAENKDFAKTSKSAWIKKYMETQSLDFTDRLVKKFAEAQKDIDEENKLLDEQIEKEVRERKEQLTILDVILPEK